MAQKLFIVVLVTVLSQGFAFPPENLDFIEIQLPDLSYVQQNSPMIAYVYGIPRDMLDRQVHCRVNFPSGVTYNLWPNFNIPEPTINVPHDGVTRGCYISFRNTPPVFSGTYELESLVSRPNGSQMLVRRKYHMTFVWNRSAGDVKADTSNKDIIAEEAIEHTV